MTGSATADIAAYIETGTGARLAILYYGFGGYAVRGFQYRRGRQTRTVHGCRTDLEAFRQTRREAKRMGRDVSAWRLIPVGGSDRS